MTQEPVIFSERQIKRIVILLLMLVPISGMGVDLIAPSLPAISAALHVSSSVSKNLIAIYLIGFGLGSFSIGFLSDALGRRKFLILSLFLFLVASLLPTFFPTANILLISRLLQGVSVGFFSVLARAIFSDILPPNRLMRTMVFMPMIWGIGPILGPVIGGYLQFYFDWQANFYFLAIPAFLGLISTFFFIPETHFNRHPLNLPTIKKHLHELMSHKMFIGCAVLMAATYSLIIIFNTLGPFLIETTWGYSPVFFGKIGLWMGVAYVLATIACRHLLKKNDAIQLFQYSIVSFLMCAILGLLFAYLIRVDLVLIIVMGIIMFAACGIIYPASTGKGVTFFRHIAASAASVMSLINTFSTGVVAFLMGFITIHTAVALLWLYVLFLSICFAAYWFLIRTKSEHIA